MSQTKTLKKIVDDKYTVSQLEEKLNEREVDYKSSGLKPHKVEKFVEEYLTDEEKENLLTKTVDKGDEENDTISNEEEEAGSKEENDDYPPKPYWMDPKVYKKRKENGEPLTKKHK